VTSIREELRERPRGGSASLRPRASEARPGGRARPLYVRDGELHAVFTNRRACAGIPGDLVPRRPAGPRRGAATTALRGAEEIGLATDDVDLLGTLTPVSTFVTGYLI
jgi:hypothetical protein